MSLELVQDPHHTIEDERDLEAAIGRQVKSQRKKLGMTVGELAQLAGLSAGMLSKIERGQLFPTLPTLLRIALVFGVGLDHFFTEPEHGRVAVVRKKDRLRLPERPEGDPTYFFESLDYPVNNRRMESYYAEFESTTPSEPHNHPGAEFIYVIGGRLGIDVDGEEHVLEAGDSIYFDGNQPHRYRREGNKPCSVLVVVAREPESR